MSEKIIYKLYIRENNFYLIGRLWKHSSDDDVMIDTWATPPSLTLLRRFFSSLSLFVQLNV